MPGIATFMVQLLSPRGAPTNPICSPMAAKTPRHVYFHALEGVAGFTAFSTEHGMARISVAALLIWECLGLAASAQQPLELQAPTKERNDTKASPRQLADELRAYRLAVYSEWYRPQDGGLNV